MKIEDFISILKRQEASIKQSSEQALKSSAQMVHKQYVERIFDTGLDHKEQPIGKYSTRRTTFYRWNFLPSKLNKFKPTGYYTSKGKVVPYMVLNGYKELKSIQGLNSSFVDLTYTGSLKKDFSQVPKRLNSRTYQGYSFFAYGIKIEDNNPTSPGWDTPSKPKAIGNASKVVKNTSRFRTPIGKHSVREEYAFISSFNRILNRLVFRDTPISQIEGFGG
jgi:hypothetical protein